MSDSSASADLIRLLGKFIDAPSEAHLKWAAVLGLIAPTSLETWRVRHAQSFIEQCYPFASVYLGPEGAIGGAAANRVADFRELLGSTIVGPPDAFGTLLADYAELVERSESDPRALHAREAMLWEHLLCWLIPFFDSVERSAPTPYAPWARLTRRVFIGEARVVGNPGYIPLQLRDAPVVDIGKRTHSLDDVVRSLLVPVRSGIVITRHDLSRIANAVGITTYTGGRHLLLHSLLKQQPKATLERLANEALRQAQAHGREHDTLGMVANFWSERARVTAAALRSMAAQVAITDTGT